MKQISTWKWWRIASGSYFPPCVYKYTKGEDVYVVELTMTGHKPESFVYAKTTVFGDFGYRHFAQRMTQREWMDYMRRESMA